MTIIDVLLVIALGPFFVLVGLSTVALVIYLVFISWLVLFAVCGFKPARDLWKRLP